EPMAAALNSVSEVLNFFVHGWFATLSSTRWRNEPRQAGALRIGLEAGPPSQWLSAAMKEAGLAVELIETRHVKAAAAFSPVKTDRNDARMITYLMRLGWFASGQFFAAIASRVSIRAIKIEFPNW